MAHPDPNRSGSEKGQRQHAGQDSEYTDAGVKDRSQGATGAGPTPIEDDRARDALRPSGADTRTNDLEPRSGLVASEERSDQEGPLRGTLDRESGAGAAGGRDTSGGTSRGAGAFGRASGGADPGSPRTGKDPSGR